MSRGWMQFFLVAVPVLSLVGSWLALRAAGGRRRQGGNQDKAEGE